VISKEKEGNKNIMHEKQGGATQTLLGGKLRNCFVYSGIAHLILAPTSI
jgi:hypothetical protein